MSAARRASAKPPADPAHTEAGVGTAAIYFTSLEVENVRTFGAKQRLKISDANGRAAPWTLIIGENGVGKTTLLQCLAQMQPFPSLKKDEAGTVTEENLSKDPDWVEPDLLGRETSSIIRMLRVEPKVTTRLKATLEVCPMGLHVPDDAAPRTRFEIGAEFDSEGGALKGERVQQAHFTLPKPGPLVVGYGAARHVGHANRSRVREEEATASLFKDATDLYDAEEILFDMDYTALDSVRRKKPAPGETTPEQEKLDAVLSAVAALLPDQKPENIKINGPKVPGKAPGESGVQIVFGGEPFPLTELSIGYQTMFAWTVDLAWRMLERYPHSPSPMSEPAIVLVDEIDLHLHPRWQRELRERLSRHFPNVQFIATTHSPFTAQEALASSANLCVVRLRVDESEILDDPVAAGDWRLDQVATSDLFGLTSARAKRAEEHLERRRLLVAQTDLTAEEQAELEQLDSFSSSLPTAPTPAEQGYRDDVKRVANKIRLRAKSGK